MIASLSRRIDWQLVAPVIFLVFVSLATLWSINITFFRLQLVFLVISAVIFLLFSQINVESLRFYSPWIYGLSLAGFLFLLFLGIEARGAVRWLDLFGLQIQFSEVFKPFLAISLASFLATKERTSWSAVKTLLFLAPVAFLIIRQPDLGSAILYVLVTLLTLLLYGFPLWWFVAGGVGLLGLAPIIFQFLKAYQRQRILTFLHLTNDPLGTSYNAIQAVIAAGSGGFVGKGFGQGTQSALRFLPERHTDFIFATLAEDIGFLGAIIVIAAFLFLLYRLYTIFLQTDNIFEKVFIAASFSLFLIQIFVNIGMNIGMLPIVGVPLPFVSYGGSSLVSSAIFLGLLSSLATSERKKSALEIT